MLLISITVYRSQSSGSIQYILLGERLRNQNISRDCGNLEKRSQCHLKRTKSAAANTAEGPLIYYRASVLNRDRPISIQMCLWKLEGFQRWFTLNDWEVVQFLKANNRKICVEYLYYITLYNTIDNSFTMCWSSLNRLFMIHWHTVMYCTNCL